MPDEDQLDSTTRGGYYLRKDGTPMNANGEPLTPGGPAAPAEPSGDQDIVVQPSDMPATAEEGGEPPTEDYDSLNVAEVLAAVEDGLDADLVLAYERTHKNRSGIIKVLEED